MPIVSRGGSGNVIMESPRDHVHNSENRAWLFLSAQDLPRTSGYGYTIFDGEVSETWYAMQLSTGTMICEPLVRSIHVYSKPTLHEGG